MRVAARQPLAVLNPTYERVLGWADRNPAQPCLVTDARRISFGELFEQVARNRHQLMRLGVGAGDLVAISSEQRGAAIAGMLAAWSLGAAYLPLSPALPEARVHAILDIARPAALLVGGKDPLAPAGWEGLSAPAGRLNPEAAYVIFTSGSTGTPKGVVLGHTGLDLLIRWHQQQAGLVAGECASQLADLAFDASVWEIWGTLAHGGCLVVPTLDQLLEAAELQRFLLDQQISTGFIPTGLMPGLLDLDWPRECRLRLLFTGGDRLTRWPASRHPFHLVNAYGPTECTVVATSQSLSCDEATGTPPIGRPLPHVRTAVLDPAGNRVASGAAGELLLGGQALALGYLGSSETAFERLDLGDGPRRWYRTGDQVRVDPSGALHYLSRIDHQVQIGGRRTEPAEIVRAILGVPSITDAVVFTRQTASGEMRLAAAVTPQTTSRRAIQERLAAELPLYMIPSEILTMRSFPLTARGKVDLDELRRVWAELVGATPAVGLEGECK